MCRYCAEIFCTNHKIYAEHALTLEALETPLETHD